MMNRSLLKKRKKDLRRAKVVAAVASLPEKLNGDAKALVDETPKPHVEGKEHVDENTDIKEVKLIGDADRSESSLSRYANPELRVEMHANKRGQGYFAFECPWCGVPMIVDQNDIGCGLARHGTYLTGSRRGRQLHKNTPQKECDRLRAAKLVQGCTELLNLRLVRITSPSSSSSSSSSLRSPSISDNGAPDTIVLDVAKARSNIKH
jgi:hypothetical protein